MNLIFYQSRSDYNVLDKELYSQSPISGTLRGECSVSAPVLLIEDSDNILNYNYVYISEWKRYYFITNITSVRNNLWEVSCSIDVLMTYRTQIRQQSGIIARQENLYNLYLDDDRFLVNAQRIYWTKTFPNRVNPASSGAQSFIFTCAGGKPTGESSS